MRRFLVIACAACSGPAEGEREIASDETIDSYDIARDADGFAVVWATFAGRTTDDRVWFARLSADGALASEPVAILDLSLTPGSVHLFATPTGYVFWHRDDEQYFGKYFARQLDANGQPAGDSIELGRTNSRLPAIVQVADGFVVATDEENGNGDSNVRLSRVSAQLAETAQAFAAPTQAMSSQFGPALTLWQQQPLACWWEDGIHIALMDANLVAVDNPEIASAYSEPARCYSIAATATRAIAAWPDDTDHETGLALYDGTTWTQYPATSIPRNRDSSSEAVLASQNDRLAIVWINDHDLPLGQVTYAELDDNGIASGTQRTLSDARWAFDRPRLVAGSSGFLVAYRGDVAGKSRLYFTHVD